MLNEYRKYRKWNEIEYQPVYMSSTTCTVQVLIGGSVLFSRSNFYLSETDGKIISNIFKPLKSKPLTEVLTSSSPQEAAGFMGNVD